MNKIILFSLCAVLFGLVVILNTRPCQAARNPADEDEFSEFELDDDSSSNQNAKKKQSEPKPAKADPKKEADFTNFDETIDDEEDPEFETPKTAKKPTPPPVQQAKQAPKFATDDLDMEEFEHFADDEEFETLETNPKPRDAAKKSAEPKSSTKQDANKMPSLKIADVPKHLISNGNWQNYVWEICMIGVICIYFANFIYGKSKNYSLASAWFQANRDLLERNFCVVGDDGSTPDPPSNEPPKEVSDEDQHEPAGPSKVGALIKDSENSYGLWCSGRQSCDGMLVQLKLIKRQDLINGLLMQLVKPQSDQIILSVEYPSKDSLDNFVFCLTNKKASQRLFNDYQDLATYCSKHQKHDLPRPNTRARTRH